MPARNPRVNVVLERPLHQTVRRLARRDSVSVSAKVRDLLIEALEAEEDAALTALAERRERSFDRAAALSHSQVWKRARRRK